MNRKGAIALAILAAAIVAALRCAHIGALPIFNDEAIYLRWAQLIAAEPSLAIRIPLIDPKPPLHIALVAAFMNTAFDPLVAARAVSAIAGAAMIPLVILLLRELKFGAGSAVIAVALIATSPFLSFYQRLATADSLFVTESVACALLALKLGRTPLRRMTTVGLGVTLGLALLTRQVFSLMLFPVTFAAVVLNGGGRRGVLRWIVAALVAVAFLLPYLVAIPKPYAADFRGELTRRLLHKSQLGERSLPERVAAFRTNARQFTAPDLSGSAVPESGWLWHYLTPPVYVVAAISLTWLLFRRQSAGALFLLWAVAIAAPTIVFGVVAYPRYGLAATVPLLLAVAAMLGETLPPRFIAIPLVLICALPARDLHTQMTRWDMQRLLRVDRWQYITGWSGGHAMRQALEWVDARLANENATFITGEGWGIPDDVIWVRFATDRRVTLRYVASTRSVPDLATTETFAPTWHPRARREPIPPQGPVYYFARLVGTEPMQSGGATVEDPIPFVNPRMSAREPWEGVVVYRLR